MIQIIALLYAGAGGRPALKAYEAQVVPLLHGHGGRLISASHPSKPRADDPDEIQVVHFETMAGFDAFMGDPRHAALTDQRKAALRDTRLYVTDQFVTYID